MDFYLSLIKDSKCEVLKPHDKTYIFDEKELIKALEYVYDKGMEWAYNLVKCDLNRLSGENNNGDKK